LPIIKNSNARRFLVSYVLKLYEVRRLKKSFAGSDKFGLGVIDSSQAQLWFLHDFLFVMIFVISFDVVKKIKRGEHPS